MEIRMILLEYLLYRQSTGRGRYIPGDKPPRINRSNGLDFFSRVIFLIVFINLFFVGQERQKWILYSGVSVFVP